MFDCPLPWRRTFLAWAAIACCASLILQESVNATPHPFHVCIGQMQWNQEAGHWEVSLRLHPQDLERAMATSRQAAVSLEDDSFPTAATEFLEDQFFIVRVPETLDANALRERLKNHPSREAKKVPASEERSQLRWVGMEQERGWLWIHLEMVPPTASPSGQQDWLVHRVFLDQIERQENSVRILQGGIRYSLQYKKEEPVQKMQSAVP